MGVAHTRKSLVKGERFIRDVWKTWVNEKGNIAVVYAAEPDKTTLKIVSRAVFWHFGHRQKNFGHWNQKRSVTNNYSHL